MAMAAVAKAVAARTVAAAAARQQAQAEGLTLRVAKTRTGYFNVHLVVGQTRNPFKAEVSPYPNPDPN